MGIPVKLEVFEGPLDLLLHLIEKNKVDIYDIPIVEITNQYMEYIRAMEQSDLNIMSEFLLMAATLLDIKCRMLLPAEVNEDGEEEDPRAELVEQLIQYKMYKYMSYELKDRQLDGERLWFKEETMPDEVKDFKEPVDLDALLEGVTLSKLHAVFQDVFGKIEKEEVTVEEKMDYLQEYIQNHKQFRFRELLQKQSSKIQLVVTFLAILELMKTGMIVVEQEKTFDEIIITANI